MFMVLVDTPKAPVKQTAELSSSMTHYFAVFSILCFVQVFYFLVSFIQVLQIHFNFLEINKTKN